MVKSRILTKPYTAESTKHYSPICKEWFDLNENKLAAVLIRFVVKT